MLQPHTAEAEAEAGGAWLSYGCAEPVAVKRSKIVNTTMHNNSNNVVASILPLTPDHAVLQYSTPCHLPPLPLPYTCFAIHLTPHSLLQFTSEVLAVALALHLYGESGSLQLHVAMLVATTLPGLLLLPTAGTVVDKCGPAV